MNRYQVSAIRLKLLAERYPNSLYPKQLRQILTRRRPEAFVPTQGPGCAFSRPGFNFHQPQPANQEYPDG